MHLTESQAFSRPWSSKRMTPGTLNITATKLSMAPAFQNSRGVMVYRCKGNPMRYDANPELAAL